MADVTISDLELAPALADDMVFPVENTTDTYAATLAMLRRLINKTFVEVANADFNSLTDDGFYQCTGTPTNAPEAGAINWTLQVSAESGVVVQRAFSLDDGFENFYIRRFNGVMWTAWKNMTNVVGTPFSLGDSRYFEVAPYNTSWLASNGQYNSSFLYPSMWGQLQVELSNINVGEVGTYKGYSYTKRGLPVVLSTGTITDYDFVVNQNDQTFRLPLKSRKVGGGSLMVFGNGNVMPLWDAQYYSSPGFLTYGAGYSTNLQVATPGQKVGTGLGAGVQTATAKGLPTKQQGVDTGVVADLADATNDGLKLYFYVGDTVQDASLINAGAVLGQLSDKISRTATSDRELVIGWGMPDYTAAIDISGYNSASNQFTAPCDGECHITAWAGNNTFVGIYVNDKIISGHLSASANASANVARVSKGDRFYFAGNPYPNVYGAVYNFFPYKGAI